MTCKDKASYRSSPPCSTCCMHAYTCLRTCANTYMHTHRGHTRKVFVCMCVTQLVTRQRQTLACSSLPLSSPPLSPSLHLSPTHLSPAHPSPILCVSPASACERARSLSTQWISILPTALRQSNRAVDTGWRRLIESPELQIIFHKRAT